jgi:Cu/Ag efflux pump CusA
MLVAVLVGVMAVRVGVVMVILFRSLLVPVVILCTLPLAIIDAFVALAVTGHALDLSMLIGLLMLRGIVVTNAIVLHGIEAGDDVRTDNFQSGVEAENLSDWYWYSHSTYTVRILP